MCSNAIACDLITPSAELNVIPHLDDYARAVLGTAHGPVMEANGGLRHF